MRYCGGGSDHGSEGTKRTVTDAATGGGAAVESRTRADRGGAAVGSGEVDSEWPGETRGAGWLARAARTRVTEGGIGGGICHGAVDTAAGGGVGGSRVQGTAIRAADLAGVAFVGI